MLAARLPKSKARGQHTPRIGLPISDSDIGMGPRMGVISPTVRFRRRASALFAQRGGSGGFWSRFQTPVRTACVVRRAS